MAPKKRFITCEICGHRSSRKNGAKRTFMANFPLNEDRCRQWVKAVGKEDLIYVPIEKLHSLKSLCGDHFAKKAFNKKMSRLRRSAIPTLNLKAVLSDEMLLEFPYRIHPTNSGSQKISDTKPSQSKIEAIPGPSTSDLVPAPPKETQTLSGIDEALAGEFITYDVPVIDHDPSPVPGSIELRSLGKQKHSYARKLCHYDHYDHSYASKSMDLADSGTSHNRAVAGSEVEDTAENKVFSWQKTELIEADDPDDPPVRAPPPPAAPSLALLNRLDQAVPTQPAPAEKDVENRCKDCAEVNEGFWFWCVECAGGALCGACAGRPPHHPHHVLRAPMHANRTQTQAVLMVIRQQLQNENLLPQHETLDNGLKVEVKEEPPEPPPADPPPAEPEPPAEPDLLTCAPHENQSIAKQIVDHHQLLKLPQLPEAHAHKQNLPLGTKLVKVSTDQVKRKCLLHIEKKVTTQQQVKGLQTTFPACEENLVTQPSKAREHQGPKSLLKPLTSSPSQTAGNFTSIRPNHTSTQAPTSTKVNSEPKPSETVKEEGLDSDIKTVEEVVLDDNETNEDDNRVTNEDGALDHRATNEGDALDDRATNEGDALDDRATNEGDALDDRATNEGDALDDRATNEGDALDDRATNEGDGLDDRATSKDDDGLEDRDDVLDEDYLVAKDYLSEDDESDEDTIGNLARKGVKRKKSLNKQNSGQTLLPLDSIIREDDLMEDDLSDEDPVVNIAGRGVKRKEDVEETSPVPPHGSQAQELPSKAVVQVRPLSSLQIRNWTADRKRHRKH